MQALEASPFLPTPACHICRSPRRFLPSGGLLLAPTASPFPVSFLSAHTANPSAHSDKALLPVAWTSTPHQVLPACPYQPRNEVLEVCVRKLVQFFLIAIEECLNPAGGHNGIHDTRLDHEHQGGDQLRRLEACHVKPTPSPQQGAQLRTITLPRQYWVRTPLKFLQQPHLSLVSTRENDIAQLLLCP